ncbi:MAG: hypothetical protein IJ291_01320 [Lachnospiraceae bacterium]|nr:hypothetical protein [Lachnospiraceae bacterium]
MAKDSVNDDIQRALGDVLGSMGQSFISSTNNKKMEAVMEDYKREMLTWFTEGNAEEENPLKCATKELWYSLYLEKKRLESHRCKVQYPQYEPVSLRPLERPENYFTYKKDGKYLVCCANQPARIEKRYIRDGVIIGCEQKTYDMDYYILCSQNENGLFICPNCGAELPREALLDGCDYCKSKFDISAYDEKVVSVVKNKGIYATRVTHADHTPASAILLAIVGMFVAFFGFLLAGITLGLSLIPAALGVLAIYFSLRIAMNENRKHPDSIPFRHRLQDNNPGFSEEAFIGSLDCKLKAIHYASDPRELAAFVKCDVAPFVKNYQDLVNCEIGKLCYKDYRVEEGCQYLTLHREIIAMKDCGNTLKPVKGYVRVTLMKKNTNKIKHDVVLYRCNNCGSTISLVEGGKCKHCGTEMDYAAYDWVITDYSHAKTI